MAGTDLAPYHHRAGRPPGLVSRFGGMKSNDMNQSIVKTTKTAGNLVIV